MLLSPVLPMVNLGAAYIHYPHISAYILAYILSYILAYIRIYPSYIRHSVSFILVIDTYSFFPAQQLPGKEKTSCQSK